MAVSSALIAALAGCSLGQGEGEVHSDALYARDCVMPSPEDCPAADGVDVGCDNYDLLPDFFAAVPFRDTTTIRVQRGTDISELSDGLAVLVNDVSAIGTALKQQRNAAIAGGATEQEALELYVEVPVAMPIGVTPVGTPPAPAAPCDEATQLCTVQPASVSLYLQKSCHNQNIVLYAVAGYIRFHSLCSRDIDAETSGYCDPNEKSAAAKYTDAEFDVVVGDPRDAPMGEPIDADAIPAELTSHLTGYFRFYFERGKPGQPFPG